MTITTHYPQMRPALAAPWFAARIVSGVLLLAAAFLKLRAGPIEGWGLAAHLLLVHAEVALGCWLLSGWFPRPAALTGCACFAAFAIYSGSRAVAGHDSCGCFGQFAVNPWITASVDALLAIGLGLSARAEGVRARKRWRSARPIVGCVAGMVILAFAWWPRETAGMPGEDLSALGTVSGNLVILEPEKWPRHRLALASFVEDGDRLMQGDWVILLYHDGCSTCAAAVPRYRSALAWGESNMPHLAFVEIPPFGTPITPSSGEWVGRLKESHDWFATTPVVVHVRHGMVLATASGEAAASATEIINEWGITERRR